MPPRASVRVRNREPQLRARVWAAALFAVLPASASAQREWIDEFPTVTMVAHAAWEELAVTSARGGVDTTRDDDAIAINLVGSFIVLRQILALKHAAGPADRCFEPLVGAGGSGA